MLSLSELCGSRKRKLALHELISANNPMHLDREGPRHARRPLRYWRWRRIALLLVALLIGVTATLALLEKRHVSRRATGMPPSYEEIREYERGLPQHDTTLPWPEGIDGRFVRFETTYHAAGFNNQLQDIIMLAQIAYMSNRAFAFPPYVYKKQWMSKIINENGNYKSADLPLNALIEGPMSGGHMGPGSGRTPSGDVASWEAPRSVTWEWYNQVCPWWRRTYIKTEEIRKQMDLQEEEGGANGLQIIEGFSKFLTELNASCVSVTGDHVFTYRVFGPPMTDAFEIMQDSPVLTGFRWSPLVRALVVRNLPLLIGPNRYSGMPSNTVPEELPGLLAAHLRRGDFIGHCGILHYFNASYNGWNTFPEFIDRFSLDPRQIPSSSEKFQMYMDHCIPSVDDVVEKVTKVKQEWGAGSAARMTERRKLKRAYFLTNAEEDFRNEVKRRLLEAGWDHVVMSPDLLVGGDEVEVDMAADMMIGQLAEVFIGNGFSSLTSNINLLRMERKVDIDSIRFW